MSEFNPAMEVEKLRSETQSRRKRNYSHRTSKLDIYKGELLSMYQAGASGAELQRWLRKKRLKCALSTIHRYLKKNQPNGQIC